MRKFAIMPMTLEERMNKFFAHTPSIHPTAFVAPTAAIVGHVTLEEEASVWYNTVLRGDINRIHIGPRSNIQDGTVVHLADDYPVLVGELVTVGHMAMLHACTIGDECLIGMGAILLDGVELGARSIIGAGALVTGGTKIPPGSLVLGSPAKVVKTLDLDAQSKIRTWAEKYIGVARRFLEHARNTPPGVYL